MTIVNKNFFVFADKPYQTHTHTYILCIALVPLLLLLLVHVLLTSLAIISAVFPSGVFFFLFLLHYFFPFLKLSFSGHPSWRQ